MARRALKVASKPQYADPNDVADRAKEMTEPQLECRSLGHTWKPYTVDYDGAQKCYDVIHRCPRCKVRRVILMNVRGGIVRSHYDYGDSEGYLLAGLGRVVGEGRDALRLEQVTRYISTKPATKSTKPAAKNGGKRLRSVQ